MLDQSPMDREALLRLEGLQTYFDTARGLVRAVDDVDLAVNAGEVVALVGESGSGKTVLAHSILRLVPPPGRIVDGRIWWRGRDLLSCSSEEMRRLRGREVAMIFQNAQAALNPVYPVGRQLVSVIELHQGLTRADAREEALRLLHLAQLAEPEKRLSAYPHELSGGMCQRVMIAMALACRPALLIADEPTSSLDVTIQAEIVQLLLQIRDQFGMAILFISHDLGVVAQICDRVGVMLDGRIVETGPAREVYAAPKHPYTRLLLDSVPVPDPSARRDRRLASITREDVARPARGCTFRPRCGDALDICAERDPMLRDFTDRDGQVAACWLYHGASAPTLQSR